jgi:hypothetical protein
MRNIHRALLTSLLIVFAAGIARAQTAAFAASTATSEGQPGIVVVPEDVLTPLMDQPEHHFHMASKYFAQGDRTQAAAQIRIGAALLKLEAGRHDATNKIGLEDAAKQLDDLAARIAKGVVTHPKDLSDAFARADLALARHYNEMAKASTAQNEHDKTGYWFRGAADSVEDAAGWSGHKLVAGGRSTVNNARSLGAKLEGGATWSADEVAKCVSDLGSEIESLGGRV